MPDRAVVRAATGRPGGCRAAAYEREQALDRLVGADGLHGVVDAGVEQAAREKLAAWKPGGDGDKPKVQVLPEDLVLHF